MKNPELKEQQRQRHLYLITRHNVLPTFCFLCRSLSLIKTKHAQFGYAYDYKTNPST